MNPRALFTAAIIASSAGSAHAQYYTDTINQPYCREFTKIVQVGGQTQSAYGTACYQPDGSWQILSDSIPARQPVQYAPAQNQVIYVPQPSPASVFSLSFNSGPRYYRPSGYYGYRPFHYPRGWYDRHHYRHHAHHRRYGHGGRGHGHHR